MKYRGQSVVKFIDQWIFGVPLELLVGQLATHFAAVLFGVFAASMLYSKPWPSAALTLNQPSMVYAIPFGRVSFDGVEPGESVNVVIDQSGVCALNSKPLRVLAVQPVVLLSIGIDDFRSLSLVEWLKGGLSKIALATGRFKRCAHQDDGLMVERR